jgi:hypothetical protein
MAKQVRQGDPIKTNPTDSCGILPTVVSCDLSLF